MSTNVIHELLASILTSVAGRLIHEWTKSIHEDLVIMSISKASTLDTDILQETQVFDLMLHHVRSEGHGCLSCVGFDASNVMRSAHSELLHQHASRGSNLVSRGCWSALLIADVLGEEASEESVL